MGQVNFYHLTHSTPEALLASLLPRALEAGWRVELRGRDVARMEALDRALWLLGEASFLPHGLAGGPHDALQPVLLTTLPATAPAPDAREAVLSLDGAGVTPEEAARCERLWIAFDGRHEPAVIHARGQWKALTAAGAKAAYWSEESGRWQKKAES